MPALGWLAAVRPLPESSNLEPSSASVPLAAAPISTQVASVLAVLPRLCAAGDVVPPDCVDANELAVAARTARRRAAALGLSIDAESSRRFEAPPL
jgi:hypothetical protein